jgi:branched-subunit amino acid aminotransferase/4-amino-4-deoxychorismate lyase
MKISVNGKTVRHISLVGTEPEFHYGYGVFETMRTYNKQIFSRDLHLRRLRRSAKAIKLSIRPTDAQLSRWLQRHCEDSGESRIKLMAAVNCIYILSTPLVIDFDSAIYRSGVKVTTYQGQRAHPQVKGNAWVLEYLAYDFAIRHGYFDALLIGPDRTVAEAAFGNIFIVRNNIIYTAKANILPGITRHVVLSLLRKAKLPVHFRTNTLSEIMHANECIITKTTTGVVPVINISGQRIGNGKPGPITRQLIQAFNSYATQTAKR